jgi:hypothetical protein
MERRGEYEPDGFAAELFVAAEWGKQRHLVSITFGTDNAIDLLVTRPDDHSTTRSVDVKGLAKPNDSAMGGYSKKTRRPRAYVSSLLNPLEGPNFSIDPKKDVDKPLVPA